MADIAITPANVLAGPDAQTLEATAGVALTAGQPIYIDPTTQTAKLSDSDGATDTIKRVSGITLNGAAVGQPVKYATRDAELTIGATLAAGDVIYLSDTPGGLTKTIGDLEAGDRIIVVGVMVTTTKLNLSPIVGGELAA